MGLSTLGVEVSTGVKVEKVDATGVIAAGGRIPSATVLWAAGVSASPVVKMLGTTTDRAGRAVIGAFMDIPEAPNVFVAGGATPNNPDGHPPARRAPGAHSTGKIFGQFHPQPGQGAQEGPTFPFPQPHKTARRART